mgnify:CR=1 FL=1
MGFEMWWQKILLVASGGALGATLRFLIGENLIRRFGADSLPWGTLAVNALGSFAAGYLMVWFASKGESAQLWRAFLIIGVMGGMTTFSALMMESLVFLRADRLPMATLYLGITLVSGLFLVWLGAWLAQPAR